jgi:hypothetical protein
MMGCWEQNNLFYGPGKWFERGSFPHPTAQILEKRNKNVTITTFLRNTQNLGWAHSNNTKTPT